MSKLNKVNIKEKYENKINEFNLTKALYFLYNSNVICDIKSAIDIFNEVYKNLPDIRVDSNVDSRAFRNFLKELFTKDEYNNPKYNNMKSFAINSTFGQDLVRNIYFYQLTDNDIYRNIYKYILETKGKYFLEELVITTGDLSDTYYASYLPPFIMLFLRLTDDNLFPSVVSGILIAIRRDKSLAYKMLIFCYLNLDIHPNFEKLLKLLSSQMVKYKIYFNTTSVSNLLDDSNENLDSLLMDTIDYCVSNNYISRKDANFYSKALLNHNI